MKKLLSIFLIIAVTGCSSMASKTQQFSVTAIPNDADIVINGERLGRGAVTTQVKRDSSVSVMVSREGCQPMHRAIGHSINGLGILDGVGTLFFLVPAIGLATAGAYDLDEDSIHFTLICDEEINPQLLERREPDIKEEENDLIKQKDAPARG